ncbi:MAG: hypothetical protein D6739_01625, partial [Nitrospirae bacterium]
LASGTVVVNTPFGPMNRHIAKGSVDVALFQNQSQSVWWRATSEMAGSSKDEIGSGISKSLASYVGKGTLRRL